MPGSPAPRYAAAAVGLSYRVLCGAFGEKHQAARAAAPQAPVTRRLPLCAPGETALSVIFTLSGVLPE